MDIRFSQLETDLGGFSATLYRWSAQGRREMSRAFRQVGERWKGESKKRVPVDEGRLRNAIMSNTYEDPFGDITTEVGTNVEYGVYVEFGTERIAHGAVKRLGLDPEITDAQAIHWWKAKAADAHMLDTVSIAHRGGRLVTVGGGEAAGPQEQMPWLRTGWMAIKSWALNIIGNAMNPPAGRN